jgi:hypothetical protein
VRRGPGEVVLVGDVGRDGEGLGEPVLGQPQVDVEAVGAAVDVGEGAVVAVGGRDIVHQPDLGADGDQPLQRGRRLAAVALDPGRDLRRVHADEADPLLTGAEGVAVRDAGDGDDPAITGRRRVVAIVTVVKERAPGDREREGHERHAAMEGHEPPSRHRA